MSTALLILKAVLYKGPRIVAQMTGGFIVGSPRLAGLDTAGVDRALAEVTKVIGGSPGQLTLKKLAP